ncbi:MAG: hypothetical protein ACF8NJ_01390, partial [Phycisphaerales bacterium JB038]
MASPAHEQNEQPLKDRINAGSLMHGLVVVGGAAGLLGMLVAVLFAWLGDDGWRRLGFAYITNYAFFLSIALAALCFIAIQHVTRAGWSVSVRRLWELAAAALPGLAVLFVPIWLLVVLGSGEIYPWAQDVPAGFGQAQGHAQVESEPAHFAAVANEETGEHHASETAHADEHEAGHEEVAGHAEDHDAGHADEHEAGGHYDALTHKKRPYLNRTFFTIRWVVYFLFWAGLAHYF